MSKYKYERGFQSELMKQREITERLSIIRLELQKAWTAKNDTICTVLQILVDRINEGESEVSLVNKRALWENGRLLVIPFHVSAPSARLITDLFRP